MPTPLPALTYRVEVTPRPFVVPVFNDPSTWLWFPFDVRFDVGSSPAEGSGNGSAANRKAAERSSAATS